MDFKTGKTIEIIKEFLADGGDKFEINGVDLSKAVFMYRERNSSFIPIPKGNYLTNIENNNLYLNITGDVIAKAYEYQVIYTSDMKAGKYLEEYPELKVLVSKYNDLVEDVTNIIKYTKTSGAKIDSLKMTQVLTSLEPNTFWVMNSDERLEAFPIGNLNSKYQEMINKIKKEVEELIKTTKDTSLLEIQNKTLEKLQELKQDLSNAVNKYITDNREQLKGDRGPGITSITAVGDKVTVNYNDSQTTTFTVPTIPGKDGKSLEIRKVFKGSFEANKKNKITPINIGNNWKILFLKVASDFQAQGDKDLIYIKDNENNYKFIINPEFSGTFKINNGIIEFYIERDYVSLRILEASVME